MKPDNQKLDALRSDVARLAEPNVLGFYTHYDAIEIFAMRDGEEAAYNVFSILVAEEHIQTKDAKPDYLGGRIRIRSLKGWFFGIRRSMLTLPALAGALERFDKNAEWCISGDRLNVGTLAPISPQFVAPDSTESATWNGVLKNNFWSGSYVIELMDTGKTVLAPLFDEPKRLQELSTAIQKCLPIRLARMSDRVGNIVIQFPVTVLIAALAKNRVTGAAMISIAWHPQASPRPLRAVCEMQFDNIIPTYASSSMVGNQASLPTTDGPGMQRAVLWDDDKQIMRGANFIND
jgi:hypothetical protein